MRRRAFVGTIAALFAGSVAALALGRQRLKSLYLSSQWVQRTRVRLDAVDGGSGTGPLGAELESRLETFALVLLPSDPDPQGRRAVVEHLRWRAEDTPGYREAFADGMTLVEEEVRRTFPASSGLSGLSRAGATRVVATLLDGLPPRPRLRQVPLDLVRYQLAPKYRRRTRLRQHVVKEILAAYYRSPAGWALVGYNTYPGVCGGLDSYSRAPGSQSLGDRRSGDQLVPASR